MRFDWVVSLVLVTLSGQSRPRPVPAGAVAFWYSWRETLLTALLGWWAVPWGPRRAWAALSRNWRGGTPVALLLAALTASPAQAGVYAPGEVPPFQPDAGGVVRPLPFSSFRLLLADAATLAAPPTPPPAARVALSQRADELLAKSFDALTRAECEELTAALLRLRRLDAAFPLLRRLSRDRRASFPILAHAALVEQLQGDYPAAVAAQELARSEFPASLPGYTPAQVAWYLSLERETVLTLLRQRRGESARPGPAVAVDALFADPAAAARGDGIARVQQLVLWTPEDARLYWLLGELYRAAGEPSAALKIFDECVDARRFRNDTLSASRRAVQGTLAAERKRQEDEDARAFLPSAGRAWAVGVPVGLVVALLLAWQVRLWLGRASGRKPDV